MWPGPSIGSRSAPRSRGVRRRLASISHVYSLAPHSRVSSNGSCRRAHALICRLPAAATSSYFGSEMTFANTATYCKPWLIRESFSWYDSATFDRNTLASSSRAVDLGGQWPQWSWALGWEGLVHITVRAPVFCTPSGYVDRMLN